MKLTGVQQYVYNYLARRGDYVNSARVRQALCGVVLDKEKVLKELEALGIVEYKFGKGWKYLPMPKEGTGPSYVVYKAGLLVGDGFVMQCDTEEDALENAARLTDQDKKPFYVAKLVAVVRPVVQPLHVIERV